MGLQQDFPDTTQCSIAEKFNCYLDLVSQEHSTKYHPLDMTYLKDDLDGVCLGFSLSWLFNHDQFNQDMKLISQWNGQIEALTISLRNIFERQINNVIWLEGLHHILGEGYQNNILALINTISSQQYEKISEVGFVFKREEFENFFANHVKAGQKLEIYVDGHSIAVRKTIDNKFLLYNSNSLIGEYKSSLEFLYQEICYLFNKNKTKPLGMTVTIYDNKSELLSSASQAYDSQREAISGFLANLVNKRIEKGEVNLLDADNNNALFYAAFADDTLTATKLINAGIKILTGKFNPLDVAAQRGNLALCQEIIHQPLAEDFFCDSKALSNAAFKGYVEIVNLCLAKRFPIDKKWDGSTALYYAAQNGQLDTIKELIAAGANINEKNFDNNTALFAAATNGHQTVVEYLMAQGANIEQAGLVYRPIEIAIICGYKPIVELFATKGANTSVRGYLNLTPIELAKKAGQHHIAEYLRKHNLSVKKLNLFSPSQVTGKAACLYLSSRRRPGPT